MAHGQAHNRDYDERISAKCSFSSGLLRHLRLCKRSFIAIVWTDANLQCLVSVRSEVEDTHLINLSLVEALPLLGIPCASRAGTTHPHGAVLLLWHHAPSRSSLSVLGFCVSHRKHRARQGRFLFPAAWSSRVVPAPALRWRLPNCHGF